MSLSDYQKKSPSVIQSLFKRELGIYGLRENLGKESTNPIDTIIVRQLIKSRASRKSPSSSDSDPEKANRACKNLEYRILKKIWSQQERTSSHVLVLDDKIFIKHDRGKPYICYIILPNSKSGVCPVLKEIYSIPSTNSWTDWEISWPFLTDENVKEDRQHKILFVLEKPGHFLQSFYFETGKPYKKIFLDKDVQFKKMERSVNALILNSVKASIGAKADSVVVDFIVLSWPELKLVTRCRMTKSALEHSTVEVFGDYIIITTGKKIEICDLLETIKKSFCLVEPDSFVPTETQEIPVTHMVMSRPQPLRVVENCVSGFLAIGEGIWPPHLIKKNKSETFEVLPLGEPSIREEGKENLSLKNEMVMHQEDHLCMHPDFSCRLILAGQNEIRVILVTQDECGNYAIRKTKFEEQFFKNMVPTTESLPPRQSRRPGMREIRRSYQTDLSDEDQGVMSWKYVSELDLFVVLEFSTTILTITLYDNQNWTKLATINLSDSTCLSGTRPLYLQNDFIPGHFLIDIISSEFLVIKRCSTTERQVSNLFVFNLLTDPHLLNL